MGISPRLKLRSIFKHTLNEYIFSSKRNVLGGHYIKELCTYSKESFPVERIRNFCIIAHVDHGKSTLADRFLELTGAIANSKQNKQVLDRLPVEKERGITVKAVAASLYYTYKDEVYQLNLIDTPGHVDFSNEVSRSLSASQGVILLIDANEGIQAQTVANYYLATSKGLTILPVLNKIDLPKANPDEVMEELLILFNIDPSTVNKISAKTGLGVEDVLRLVIEKVPHPKVNRDEPFKALVVDSWHDHYRGNVLFVYISSGSVRVGDEITNYSNGKSYPVKTISRLCPDEVPVTILVAGEVGAITCNIKDSKDVGVGDTIFAKGHLMTDVQVIERAKPILFAGLFPKNQAECELLGSALQKLLLNDASVSVTLDSSPVFGSGWQLGFLGLLHLDVFRQRLEQEFDVESILTAPSITYEVKIKGDKLIKKHGGELITVRNPSNLPDVTNIVEMYEPIILASIILPIDYYTAVVEECTYRRGVEKDSTILTNNRILLKYELPLSEILLDFHDTLKKITSGYASYDYENAGFVSAPLHKLEFLLNGNTVDELAMIVHASRLNEIARKMTLKLKELIPRQQVLIRIQAKARGKILASEDIKAYRKDVTHKLHGGGDLTRRTRLLKAQREGKKKMREIANIQVHRDTFIEALREYNKIK